MQAACDQLVELQLHQAVRCATYCHRLGLLCCQTAGGTVLLLQGSTGQLVTLPAAGAPLVSLSSCADAVLAVVQERGSAASLQVLKQQQQQQPHLATSQFQVHPRLNQWRLTSSGVLRPASTVPLGATSGLTQQQQSYPGAAATGAATAAPTDPPFTWQTLGGLPQSAALQAFAGRVSSALLLASHQGLHALAAATNKQQQQQHGSGSTTAHTAASAAAAVATVCNIRVTEEVLLQVLSFIATGSLCRSADCSHRRSSSSCGRDGSLAAKPSGDHLSSSRSAGIGNSNSSSSSSSRWNTHGGMPNRGSDGPLGCSAAVAQPQLLTGLQALLQPAASAPAHVQQQLGAASSAQSPRQQAAPAVHVLGLDDGGVWLVPEAGACLPDQGAAPSEPQQTRQPLPSAATQPAAAGVAAVQGAPACSPVLLLDIGQPVVAVLPWHQSPAAAPSPVGIAHQAAAGGGGGGCGRPPSPVTPADALLVVGMHGLVTAVSCEGQATALASSTTATGHASSTTPAACHQLVAGYMGGSKQGTSLAQPRGVGEVAAAAAAASSSRCQLVPMTWQLPLGVQQAELVAPGVLLLLSTSGCMYKAALVAHGPAVGSSMGGAAPAPLRQQQQQQWQQQQQPQQQMAGKAPAPAAGTAAARWELQAVELPSAAVRFWVQRSCIPSPAAPADVGGQHPKQQQCLVVLVQLQSGVLLRISVPAQGPQPGVGQRKVLATGPWSGAGAASTEQLLGSYVVALGEVAAARRLLERTLQQQHVNLQRIQLEATAAAASSGMRQSMVPAHHLTAEAPPGMAVGAAAAASGASTAAAAAAVCMDQSGRVVCNLEAQQLFLAPAAIVGAAAGNCAWHLAVQVTLQLSGEQFELRPGWQLLLSFLPEACTTPSWQLTAAVGSLIPGGRWQHRVLVPMPAAEQPQQLAAPPIAGAAVAAEAAVLPGSGSMLLQGGWLQALLVRASSSSSSRAPAVPGAAVLLQQQYVSSVQLMQLQDIQGSSFRGQGWSGAPIAGAVAGPGPGAASGSWGQTLAGSCGDMAAARQPYACSLIMRAATDQQQHISNASCDPANQLQQTNAANTAAAKRQKLSANGMAAIACTAVQQQHANSLSLPACGSVQQQQTFLEQRKELSVARPLETWLQQVFSCRGELSEQLLHLRLGPLAGAEARGLEVALGPLGAAVLKVLLPSSRGAAPSAPAAAQCPAACQLQLSGSTPQALALLRRPFLVQLLRSLQQQQAAWEMQHESVQLSAAPAVAASTPHAAAAAAVQKPQLHCSTSRQQQQQQRSSSTVEIQLAGGPPLCSSSSTIGHHSDLVVGGEESPGQQAVLLSTVPRLQRMVRRLHQLRQQVRQLKQLLHAASELRQTLAGSTLGGTGGFKSTNTATAAPPVTATATAAYGPLAVVPKAGVPQLQAAAAAAGAGVVEGRCQLAHLMQQVQQGQQGIVALYGTFLLAASEGLTFGV